MWKNIKNVASAVADIVTILAKETKYAAQKLSSATEGVTSQLSSKAASIRATYEQNLSDRKNGIIKPVVVPESEVPKDVAAIN